MASGLAVDKDVFVLEDSPENTPPLDSRVEDEADDTIGKETVNSEKTETVLYVEFQPGDPRNPFTFPRWKKWLITYVAVFTTALVASASSTFATASRSMLRDLNGTQIQAATALSVYPLGFAVTPLVTASFSEEFGRRPLYLVTGFIFMMCHIGIALAKNMPTVIVLRFIQGGAGSTGSTMVGGSIADIWATHERGLPMSIFSLAAVGATGAGPAVSGWIELNRHLEWRWIQWIHAIVAGVALIAVYFVMVETRGGVILTREARKLRKETGDSRYRARIEDERQSLRKLIWISCTRPILLLVTEPVVASFSLWIGFAWGILYGQIESISLVFTTLYGFNPGQVGLMFLSIAIGGLFAFFANFYQEVLYRKYVHTRGPEARLISAMVAGILFPAGCFIYAWTSYPSVNWTGPFIGLTVFNFATFIIYLSVFSYVADCYLIYASSGLAGQSLCRNLMGTAFPLFTDQMYERLGFHWASTLLALVALAMSPIPFILFFWGPKIRARSRFAKRLEKWKGEQAAAASKL